ncbi:hypothetical protein A2U01_0069970, partial [Trifolium medium]|nr:hypothetical protein [Trifolium medium]
MSVVEEVGLVLIDLVLRAAKFLLQSPRRRALSPTIGRIGWLFKAMIRWLWM